jgi:hypothetical protein
LMDFPDPNGNRWVLGCLRIYGRINLFLASF